MWRALAGPLPPAGCLTWQLQTLLFEGPWLPDAPPLVTGVLPPTTGNWPDISGAAPKTIRKKRSGNLNGTMGKGQGEKKGRAR